MTPYSRLSLWWGFEPLMARWFKVTQNSAKFMIHFESQLLKECIWCMIGFYDFGYRGLAFCLQPSAKFMHHCDGKPPFPIPLQGINMSHASSLILHCPGDQLLFAIFQLLVCTNTLANLQALGEDHLCCARRKEFPLGYYQWHVGRLQCLQRKLIRNASIREY